MASSGVFATARLGGPAAFLPHFLRRREISHDLSCADWHNLIVLQRAPRWTFQLDRLWGRSRSKFDLEPEILADSFRAIADGSSLGLVWSRIVRLEVCSAYEIFRQTHQAPRKRQATTVRNGSVIASGSG
ncbi:hypothetical protein D3C81_1283870 [compost metagenome]